MVTSVVNRHLCDTLGGDIMEVWPVRTCCWMKSRTAARNMVANLSIRGLFPPIIGVLFQKGTELLGIAPGGISDHTCAKTI